jgi:RNA polymerase sigma factor (sigma-70 family)
MQFQSVRARLFGIAYHTLGRASDAEDVLQEAWVCWQRTDRTQVRDSVAFLVTITRRVALNAVMSAHARREVSVGDRLPERTRASVDPALEAERGEAIAGAAQLLLERLSPAERAVYVLREAFEYPFRQIADVLGLSEANVRQLACRARKHLAGQRHRPAGPAERDRLRDAFLNAARAGDMAGLTCLLIGDSANSSTVSVRLTDRPRAGRAS